MGLDQAQAVECAAEQPRDEVVHRADGDEGDPAERARVHVADGPVGVVRERVHGLDRHHRPLEGGHAVEGDGDDQEAQHRIGAQLLPGAGQRHDAVDHPAPGRREQDERHHHPQRLRPVGQGGVVQVVGAGPHVGEDERPEVHDGQPVGIDRAPRLLGHEVVHDPEEAGGQEEADRVVPVPPLHHRVLHPGVEGVGLPQAHRDDRAVDDVQQGHGEDEGGEEPVRHVDVAHPAPGDGAEEDHRVGHPHHRDEDVDRPFELRVLLALGDAQRQGDRGEHDHRLPAPEGERREPAAEQAHVAGALRHVVRGREQRTAAEREDHRVGVQGAEAAVADPGEVEVERRPRELRGDDHPDQHAHDPPHDGHHRELAHHGVVVGLAHVRSIRFHPSVPSPLPSSAAQSRFASGYSDSGRIRRKPVRPLVISA